MTDESGPITKLKYSQTYFNGLKAVDSIMYNNGYEESTEMRYFLVKRYRDEEENFNEKIFIGKDYIVFVTSLRNNSISLRADFSRPVYIDAEGIESFENWENATNVNVSGAYENEYEFENATEQFTFTRAQVNSGFDTNGNSIQIYELNRKPKIPKESILLPSMKPMRNAILEEENGNVNAAVKYIQNIVAAQALNRRKHLLMSLNKRGGKRQKRTLKKRHTKSRRNGLRRL